MAIGGTLAKMGGGSTMMGLVRCVMAVAFGWRMLARMGLLPAESAQPTEIPEAGPSSAASTYEEEWGDEEAWGKKRRPKTFEETDWLSDSRMCKLRDVDEQVRSQHRFEWQKALETVGSSMVLVEVLSREEASAELDQGDLYALAHSRASEAGSSYDAFVVVDLAAEHVAVVEGGHHLQENYFGRSSYDSCMGRHASQLLLSDKEHTTLAGRMPALLRQLEVITKGEACGPRSQGGLRARLFSVSPAEVKFGAFALVISFMYARNQQRNGAFEKRAEPEPEDQASAGSKPTVAGVINAALSPLLDD